MTNEVSFDAAQNSELISVEMVKIRWKLTELGSNNHLWKSPNLVYKASGLPTESLLALTSYRRVNDLIAPTITKSAMVSFRLLQVSEGNQVRWFQIRSQIWDWSSASSGSKVRFEPLAEVTVRILVYISSTIRLIIAKLCTVGFSHTANSMVLLINL